MLESSPKARVTVRADKCSQNEAEDDSRSGDFESRRRSQQQAGPDRPADSDHGHLAGAELVAQSSFLHFSAGIRHL